MQESTSRDAMPLWNARKQRFSKPAIFRACKHIGYRHSAQVQIAGALLRLEEDWIEVGLRQVIDWRIRTFSGPASLSAASQAFSRSRSIRTVPLSA